MLFASFLIPRGRRFGYNTTGWTADPESRLGWQHNRGPAQKSWVTAKNFSEVLKKGKAHDSRL